MSIRHLGAAARVIGRRNALRYLALGVGSALVAACSSSSGKAADGSDGKAVDGGESSNSPASPAPSSPSTTARPTVADRAFDAFVRGSWTVQSTTSRGKPAQGRVTVETDGGGNGGWTIAWDGTAGKDAVWEGSFLLRGGHLSLSISQGPGNLIQESAPEALNVPATVGGTVQLTLPWKPPGSGNAGESVAVSYDGTTLRIVHAAGRSTTTHVCTRA
ncbi:hypothetical protein ACWCXH_33005 [Kitasatospora sp. NPDC001660]